MITKQLAQMVMGLLALVTLAPVAALAQAGTLFVEGENVGIGTATPTASLHVRKSNGSARLLIEEQSQTAQARELLRLVNPAGPFMIFVDSAAQKSYAFAMFAGNFLILHQQTGGAQFVLTPSGNLTISGSLTEGSSRDVKDDILVVDQQEVLEKVVELPISTWRYKTDGESVRHLGPMAEDFRASFGLGASDKGLSTLDTSGVALAAIQGLYDLVRDQSEEIQELRARLADLEEQEASPNP